MSPIYRWNGRYFGFLTDTGLLYDAHGLYVGWVTQGRLVWSAEGVYLGEMISEKYILRDTSKTTPEPLKPIPEPTVVGFLPPRPADLPPRENRPGFVDALELFDRE